jgi:hypothetical protein
MLVCSQCLYGNPVQSTSSSADVCSTSQSPFDWVTDLAHCPSHSCLVPNCIRCTASASVCAVCNSSHVLVNAGASCDAVITPIPTADSILSRTAQACVNWHNIGPRLTIRDEELIHIPLGPTSGAIPRIVLFDHTAYVATANGGIWKTDNIHTSDNTGTTIRWHPVTDASPTLTCNSIAALNIGLVNKNWIVAGCGRPSNAQLASELGGGMVSNDAGFSWRMFSNIPLGLVISGIVNSEPSAITFSVFSAQIAAGPQFAHTSLFLGLWHSTDNGITWSQSAPEEQVFAMERDPLNDSTILAIGVSGVWVSLDNGATFHVTSTGLTFVNSSSFQNDTQKIVNGAVSIASPPGQPPVANVAIVSCPVAGGECIYVVYWSNDWGISWNLFGEQGPYGAPTIWNECGDGQAHGLGEQGDPNFALLADPEVTFLHVSHFRASYKVFFEVAQYSVSFYLILIVELQDVHIIYIAGTTPPCIFSNTLGTKKWSSRIFRGDRRHPNSVSWTIMLGSLGTATGGEPASDSRHLAWDHLTGDLLYTSDGTRLDHCTLSEQLFDFLRLCVLVRWRVQAYIASN